MFNFYLYNKCLRKSTYQEKRSILVHRLRSFSPGLTDSIPLGLWWIMWWGWTVYFMRQSEQGAVDPSVTTLEGAPQRPKVHLQAFYLLNISLLPSISSLGIKLLLHRLFGKHQDAISIVVQTTRVERAGPSQLDTVRYRPRLRLCVFLGSPWVSKPELYYL